MHSTSPTMQTHTHLDGGFRVVLSIATAVTSLGFSLTTATQVAQFIGACIASIAGLVGIAIGIQTLIRRHRRDQAIANESAAIRRSQIEPEIFETPVRVAPPASRPPSNPPPPPTGQNT